MQDVNIEKWGSKLLSNSISRNNVPAEYLSISKNARIKDGTITKRLGQKTRATFSDITGAIQGLTYNKKLLVVMGGKLWEVNTTTRAKTEIGSIGTTGEVNIIDYGKYTIIFTGIGQPYVYDQNILFQLGPDTYLSAYITGGTACTKTLATWTAVLDGSFNITIDGTARSITGINFSTATSLQGVASLIQDKIRTVTSGKEVVEYLDGKFIIRSGNTTTTSAITVTTATGSGTDISGVGATKFLDMSAGTITDKSQISAPDINPLIAERYQGFTFITGNITGKDNVLYVSRPITEANPQYCFDWVGTNSEKISFDSKILGLRRTMSRLIIFTENRVEYIDKSSLQTIGDIATLVANPIGDGGNLVNHRGAVAAADKLFYLTNRNNINTVGYAEGTVEPEIGILTDEVAFRITKYLANLDEDQTGCYSYYDDENKECIWFLKTQDSLYNDTILVYDLGNKTWTTDTNKFYNDVAVVGNKTYAGSSISASIIEVGIGNDDDTTPIEFEIQDTDIMLGTTREKIFAGRQTSGSLNLNTNLEVSTLVDDNVVCLKYIRGTDYISVVNFTETGSIGDIEIGGDALGGLQSNIQEELSYFDKTLDHGNLWRRGKRIKRNIKENSLNSKFYLDFFTITAESNGNVDLNDKF